MNSGHERIHASPIVDSTAFHMPPATDSQSW